MTFAEELELQSFPFDCQDLSVIIKGNRLSKQQRFVFLPELRVSTFGSIDSRYSVLDEWDLSNALIEFADDEFKAIPTVILRLKMKRKWKVFVINIVSLLCALCGLGLSAFYLPREQLGERLSLLITLILTSVAFSIVIQDKLPNVAYLTFIDKYILASYFFLIAVVIESVLVSIIDDEEWQQDADRLLFWVFLFLWAILMGAAFIVYAHKLRQREKKKLFYSSDEVNDYNEQIAPRLDFDFKDWRRTGHKKRILSFMAHTKEDQTKSEDMRKKYVQHIDLQTTNKMSTKN